MNRLKTWLVFVGLLAIGSEGIGADSIGPCEVGCTGHRAHIATGREGGTYYVTGRALVEATERTGKPAGGDPNSIGFVVTEGSVENLAKVTDRNDPNNWLAIVQSDVLDFRHGRKKYDKFKVVGAIHHEPVYIAVRRKLRLSSIEGLRGKKVAVGLQQSGTKHTSQTILGIFGISLNEVSFDSQDTLSAESYYEQIADLLSREEIDAAFIVGAWIPEKIYKCVTEDNTAYILKVGRTDLVRIASTDPHLYRLFEVTEPFYDEKFTTIAVTSVLITECNMPEGIVCKLAEQLCKDEDEQSYRAYLKERRSYRTDSAESATDPNKLKWAKYPYVLYGEINKKLFHGEASGYYDKNIPIGEWLSLPGSSPGVAVAVLIIVAATMIILTGCRRWLWKRVWGYITGIKSCRVRMLLKVLGVAAVLGIGGVLCLLLKDMRGSSIWFPLALVVACVAPVALMNKWSERRKWFAGNTWAVWLWGYLCCICVGYFFLVAFESDAGNPDITGSPKDLLNILRDVFKLGEIFCVTKYGEAAKTGMYVVSMVFGITMLGRMVFHYIDKKIREMFEMNPKKSEGHVVICNWTPKAETIINELRSSPINERRRIYIIAKRMQEPPNRSELIARDVWLIDGNPTDKVLLEGKVANIKLAHTILILADEKHSTEPDAASLLILQSVRGILGRDRDDGQEGGQEGPPDGKNAQKQPTIIAEITKPDFEGLIKEKADKVILSTRLMAKLFAQAVITPDVTEFVQRILTAEDDSNELYDLRIPDGILEEILEGCGKAEDGCRFQDVASAIEERYREKHEVPVTVVGVRSKEKEEEKKLHINPKDEDFRDIRSKIDAALVIAWRQPQEL